jgi:hypothetical protein
MSVASEDWYNGSIYILTKRMLMRKEYTRALWRIFKQKIKENNICLVDYQLPIEHRTRGDHAYKYNNMPESSISPLACFVILIPHNLAEKFTLEIGWSESNSFPVVKMRPTGFLSQDKRELSHTDFVFRIGNLINRSDFWWTVDEAPKTIDDIMNSTKKITNEAAEAKILPIVDDVIEKLNSIVLPFFYELAAYKMKGLKG